MDFVHLHLHTEYSLTDSILRIEPLMDAVKEMNMNAVAITDHGTLAGIEKFHSAASRRGIKPIIGCEVYMMGEGRKRHHLTVIAKNKNGYFSLVKAMNSLSKEGKRGFNDDDIFSLQNVIILSGCIGGKIPSAILNDDFKKAKILIESYKDRFKDDFYLELMNTGLPQQKRLNSALVEMAKEYKIKLVATNDVHFLKREDAKAHSLFVSIGRNMHWNGDFLYGSDEYYLKSPQEMEKLFGGVKGALENTIEISEKCEEYDLRPNFELPKLSVNDDCKSLKEKIKFTTLKDQKLQRVKNELKVIESKNFCRYFLIVSDIVKTAEKLNVLVGPGRGSAVSSLVAHLLGITTVDPLKYDLIFERFLNESRKGDPDIDIDVEDTKRGRLIYEIVKKYGEDKIAQVGAYGTLGTKAVIRAVGKAMDLSDRIINDLVWRVSGYSSVKEALKKNPSLGKIARDPSIGEALRYSEALEGLAHHKTIHAAGIILSETPIKDRLPLIFNNGIWVTEFDMDSLAHLEVIKIDVLGLKTLTNIKDTFGKDANREKISSLPVDDPRIYELLKRGNTLGVFQLESPSATSLTKKMAPERFEDIVALLSLNRPGPMYSGMADEYIKRRHKLSSSKDELELDEFLKDTYGMIVYQEQIMKIASEIAGFTPSKADMFRKAVSKKKTDIMNELKDEFINGCVEHGYKHSKAERLFELINSFASYGFNKSHSVAYAYITAWTAYLKATKPAQYLASLMNSHISNMAKLSIYASEAKRLGVEILPPDVNKSDALFKADSKSIRTGLAAIKGVGISFGESVEEEKKKGRYESIQDFLARLKDTRPSKKVMEALIFSGTFDSICPNRRYIIENLDAIWDRAEGGLKALQQQLFGGADKSELPSVDEYPDYEITEKIRLQRQYFNLATLELSDKGFSMVMEKGKGKVGFYIFESGKSTIATDGEVEVEISLPFPLPEGGPFEGEFTYNENKIILDRLLRTPDSIFVYVENTDDIENIMSNLVDAKGKKVVLKLKGISVVIEDKTLKEEVR